MFWPGIQACQSILVRLYLIDCANGLWWWWWRFLWKVCNVVNVNEPAISQECTCLCLGSPGVYISSSACSLHDFDDPYLSTVWYTFVITLSDQRICMKVSHLYFHAKSSGPRGFVALSLQFSPGKHFYSVLLILCSCGVFGKWVVASHCQAHRTPMRCMFTMSFFLRGVGIIFDWRTFTSVPCAIKGSRGVESVSELLFV